LTPIFTSIHSRSRGPSAKIAVPIRLAMEVFMGQVDSTRVMVLYREALASSGLEANRHVTCPARMVE
jgi:hypothetical protein